MIDNSSLITHHSTLPFYIAGGTLHRDAQCYVERRADRELYDGLRQGQFCYVLTSRQMGKSSLMVRTALSLRESGVGVVVLDLTAIGQNLSFEQWYGGLFGSMSQQLDLEDELEDFWRAHDRLGPLQRWMASIREVVLPRYPGRVVIFVDEIDAVRSLPFSTDEFFAGIREFYNRRTEDAELERLTFCLLGVATPSDLIRDTRTTPFNIGTRIELTDFTEEEAGPLARGLGRETEVGKALLKRVLYWTGGHPYLTQRLCQAIAEEESVSSTNDIDRLCEELFFTTRARERDDNLLFVRERVLRSEVDLMSLLSLYEQVRRGKRVRDEEGNQLTGILRLSGITRVENGELKVRNRIYERVFDREWVAANLPDAEVRRQRAAYRKGLIRATAVAAVIIAVIASLGLAALKQRNRAVEESRRADRNAQHANSHAEKAQQALAGEAIERQRAEEQRTEAEAQREQADSQRIRAEQQELTNRRLLYAAQMGLAQQAWENSNIDRMQELLTGYLPKAGQEDLRGFEWYYLWRLCHAELRILPHSDALRSVVVSSDGKKLAALSNDGLVKFWDLATGRELFTLKSHRVKGWLSLALSPDGKKLVTGGDENPVQFWDTATGKELSALSNLPGWASHVLSGWDDSLAFSPDGKKLATGHENGQAKIWEVATGKELFMLSIIRGSIKSIAFSPDSQRLAVGSANGTVTLWKVATGQLLNTLEAPSGDRILSLAFSPDGQSLATSCASGLVRLWEVTTGKEKGQGFLTGPSAAQTIAYSPNGKMLATGSHDRIARLWDATTGRELTVFKGHVGRIYSVTFTPDGKRLVTGSGDRTVRLWDLTREPEPNILRGHAGTVRSVVFSPDGKRLATGSEDQLFKLWDATMGRELMPLQGVKAMESNVVTPNWPAVLFSPDGKKLAAISSYTTIKLWDAAGREL